MIQIPINAPVDLETYNIIQSDFSFKKKNTLSYKGVLHNITKSSGTGFLSTTGNSIRVSDGKIIAGESTFTPVIEAVITENDTVESSDDIIFVRKNASGISTIKKIDFNNLELNTVSGGKVDVNLDALDVLGTITTDGRFVIASFKSSQTDIYIYTSDGSLDLSFTVNDVCGSSSVTSYVYGSALFVGFDSEDMRKRYVYRIYNGGISKVVHGLGLISENGYVTGEPMFYSVKRSTTVQTNDIKKSDSITDYSNAVSSSSTIDYETGYDNNKFLSNGIRQTERFDTSTTFTATRVDSGSSSGYSTTDISHASWQSSTSSLEKNPTDYRSGSQGGAGNIENNLGLMDINCPNNSNTAVMHLYLYAMKLYESSWNLYTLPAMRRSPVGAFTDTGNYTKTWQSRARSTEISFINFSDPIGKTGEVGDGEQVFPHLRFFGNNTNEKGVYWDYGKGWVRFFYDKIHYLKYNDFGTAIYEEPLRLETFSNGETHEDIIDLQKSTSKTDYALLMSTTSDESYYTTSDSKTMDETSWRFADVDNSSVTEQSFSPPEFFTVRLHPVTEEMLASTNWVYNHSLGGVSTDSLLSIIPFSFDIIGNFRVQNYSLTNVSLSYNKTLLFTPHDMDDNYSITVDGTTSYVATWSSGKIQHATIQPSGEIKVSKMTDYIFTTNIIGPKNVIIESRNGNFTFQRAFIPYIMESTVNPYIGFEYSMPSDKSQVTSNDVYLFGFGYNSQLLEKNIASSFLLPSPTINMYLSTSQLADFNKSVMNNRKGIFRADIETSFYDNENVEEYWTHEQATTDVSYKNTRYLVSGTVNDSYDSSFSDTTWFPSAETTIYPVGILSKIEGENYITSTVDVGDNYFARFYNKNNKTYLVYNMLSSIYFGNEIFTIQSGNYYFDGQGIYYLGSQSDYTQNVFTAYAIGMEFLANSSAEAYFYSKWDKCLYLYTASNTLQRSISFADMGDIVDSLYSSAEQALYILFSDGKLFIKTQGDSCIIEGVSGNRLQSTDVGCQVISSSGYEAYNPYLWSSLVPLDIETEYLGNPDTVTKYKYVDFIFYSENPTNYEYEIEFDTLNGTEIKKEKIKGSIKKADWKNNLMRVRLVPKEIQGNALKIFLKSNDIYLFSLSIDAEQVSTVTSAPRNMRN